MVLSVNEIIKKIDEEIKYYAGLYSEYGRIKAEGLQMAKDLILSEQPKMCTVGDKIRESNESLARSLEGRCGFFEVYELEKGNDNGCPCDCDNCYESILNYLNQPINQSIR
jgi:prephenate dehydrogenase